MSEKRKTPATPDGRRKRVPPTIDLAATDVTPAAATASQDVPQEPATPPPPPPEEPAHSRSEAPPVAEPPPVQPQGKAAMIAAGIAGGVVAALVLGGVWYVLAPRPAAIDNSDQIAALQKQVQALHNRLASSAPAADGKAVDALAQRVSKMETALTNLPKSDSAVAERLAAAENAMKALGLALTALNQRSDDAASSAARAREQADAAEKAVAQLRGSVQEATKDASAAVAPAQFEGVQQRLAALEQSAKAAREEIDKALRAETATRLALSAAALRNAVVGGVPFNADLAQVKALGANEAKLTPLNQFAAAGVPSTQALAQELRALVPAMMQAAGAPAPEGGFLERLQANAGRLVRVQPIDAPPGDDPAAVLARIEVATARADIVAALADVDKLPAAARAPAQAWVAKAKARQAALDAANTLAVDTARALGSK